MVVKISPWRSSLDLKKVPEPFSPYKINCFKATVPNVVIHGCKIRVLRLNGLFYNMESNWLQTSNPIGSNQTGICIPLIDLGPLYIHFCNTYYCKDWSLFSTMVSQPPFPQSAKPQPWIGSEKGDVVNPLTQSVRIRTIFYVTLKTRSSVIFKDNRFSFFFLWKRIHMTIFHENYS
jgi:hypothetical protein